jgi:phosphoglycolate phosphatase-like HAD superfamily hydrolase
MKTVLFDLDGVLADFTLGHRRIANAEFGLPVYNTTDRPHSSWDDPDINREQENKIWQIIKDPASAFWLSLEPLVTPETFDRINRLQEKAHVYFVTTRVGATCKLQSSLWLELHGVELPSVIVTSNKGRIADILEADFAIDDKPDNVIDLYNSGYGSGVYVIDRPWNQKMRSPFDLEGPKRVRTVDEFIDKFEA